MNEHLSRGLDKETASKLEAQFQMSTSLRDRLVELLEEKIQSSQTKTDSRGMYEKSEAYGSLAYEAGYRAGLKTTLKYLVPSERVDKSK